MKHPIYTALALLSCGWLVMANARGVSLFQAGANRAAFASTAYRYRPAIHTSSSSGGWSFGSSHK